MVFFLLLQHDESISQRHKRSRHKILIPLRGNPLQARSTLAAPQAGPKKSEAACACMALTARYVSWRVSGADGTSHRLVPNGSFLPHSLVLSSSFRCEAGEIGSTRRLFAEIPGVGERNVGTLNLRPSGGCVLPTGRGTVVETGGQDTEELPAVVVHWKVHGFRV